MPEIKAPWAKAGSRCPAFLAERATDGNADEHTVYIEDAAAVGEQPGTYITMVRDDDGGVLLYDDGQTIVRRVVEQPEQLTEAFKDAVSETTKHYYHLDSYGDDLQVEYTSGYGAVEFDLPVEVNYQ
jgi:hypothetical protein